MNLAISSGSVNRAVSASAAAQLHAALDKLSPLQRAVLHRRFWECREISQIARMTKRRWTEIDQIIENTLQELRSTLGRPEADRLNTQAA